MCKIRYHDNARSLDQTKSNFNFKELKKFYLLTKKIHFIRVACHHDEVLKLKLFFQYKKFKIKYL